MPLFLIGGLARALKANPQRASTAIWIAKTLLKK
jgi:hypothetical protein